MCTRKSSHRDVQIKGVDAVEIVKRIARNGFVVAIFGKPQERWRYLVVLRQCDRPEIRAGLRSLAASLRGEGDGKRRGWAASKKPAARCIGLAQVTSGGLKRAI